MRNRNAVIAIVGVSMLVGCSADEQAAEGWDYETGRVIAVNDDRVLVAESADVTDVDWTDGEQTADELLTALNPDAIWLTVTDPSDLEGLKTGDEVQVVLDGEVEESYPAEAKAEKITVLESAE
ncbi:DUF3221 domain-containing protein [Paenibacillus sp. PL2-23]|uniref:DUF3221 domain-containing protein n=1 Tax=Paenibacillus sp. PL2-23 TaxID=2100729 RepID=UPI0030F70549